MPNSIFRSKKEFVSQYRDLCHSLYGKDILDTDNSERFYVLASLIAQKARSRALSTHNINEKKVYYFSLEFLIGPLLDNYLLNFGVHDLVEDALKDMGMDLEELCREECDPGLGNGGLGRLAACFLDSLAKEGIAGYGNGMRYRYGLFRQEIKDGRQIEKTDAWLEHGYPWETRKTASAVVVQFGGHVERHEENGRFWFTTEGAEKILAVPYDVSVVGYGDNAKVNKLRLWKAEPYADDFDLDAFNEGRYSDAFRFRYDAEAISTILYPADAGEHGKLLRLKQEYLFVSAGLQTILRTYERNYGPDWEHLGDHVCVHTNDTHPAMCGPELMRILVDEKGLDFDTAWEITTHTVSYTNHTVLPEALEKWPIHTVQALIPRTYDFIQMIHDRYMQSMDHGNPLWQEIARNTAILWDGEVRMANLSVICSYSVNGVAGLHTEILKRETLHDFAQLMPEKFNNKANGISHRRFLGTSDPALAKLVTEAIGDGWLKDASELKKLEQFYGDASFLEELGRVKHANKERLAAYVASHCGQTIDPDTLFDVQVKRFHAYKRQLLNIFKVMNLYNQIKADPSFSPRPATFIFSGKAAQSYYFAKEVIRLINSVADVVNNDPDCKGKISVCFIPNFAVSNAQLIYPAAEISEQISTAGKEASGTSNMKLMMNGAITLGTYDGANIEISELAGMENIKIFGLRVEDVERLKRIGYRAEQLISDNPDTLGTLMNQLTDGTFGALSGDFGTIHNELLVNNDYDLVLADFSSYMRAYNELCDVYGDQQRWNEMSLHNIANSGWFSSDRTIREYTRDIWHA